MQQPIAIGHAFENLLVYITFFQSSFSLFLTIDVINAWDTYFVCYKAAILSFAGNFSSLITNKDV